MLINHKTKLIAVALYSDTTYLTWEEILFVFNEFQGGELAAFVINSPTGCRIILDVAINRSNCDSLKGNLNAGTKLGIDIIQASRQWLSSQSQNQLSNPYAYCNSTPAFVKCDWDDGDTLLSAV